MNVDEDHCFVDGNLFSYCDLQLVLIRSITLQLRGYHWCQCDLFRTKEQLVCVEDTYII